MFYKCLKITSVLTEVMDINLKNILQLIEVKKEKENIKTEYCIRS